MGHCRDLVENHGWENYGLKPKELRKGKPGKGGGISYRGISILKLFGQKFR